jgi:Tol biopolymer transport system component
MSRTVLFTSATVVLALVAALLVAAETKPAEAAFPGGNGDIAFAGIKGEGPANAVYRMKADGSAVKKLADGASINSPDFSADGRKLVWSSDICPDDFSSCHRLFVANARAGTDQHSLTTFRADSVFPSWYPSGRKIVFSSDPSGDDGFNLYVVSLDENGNVAGAPTQLTEYAGPHNDGHAAVSPDGSKIAFSSDRGGDYEIYVMDANRPEGPDNPLVQLTDNTVSDQSPDWSPDGRRIVYETSRNGNAEVVVMNADGTAKKNLTHNPAHDRWPAFSPNGKMIVFSRATSDGRWEVWKMRADGTGQVRLTGDAYEAHYPDWQPLP